MPRRHVTTDRRVIFVPQTPEAVFMEWVRSFKLKRHPEDGGAIKLAELLEEGEYNKPYTVVSYGKRVDSTDLPGVPEWLIQKYAPQLLKKKETIPEVKDVAEESEPISMTLPEIESDDAPESIIESTEENELSNESAD